jgi:hypothetical protein
MEIKILPLEPLFEYARNHPVAPHGRNSAMQGYRNACKSWAQEAPDTPGFGCWMNMSAEHPFVHFWYCSERPFRDGLLEKVSDEVGAIYRHCFSEEQVLHNLRSQYSPDKVDEYVRGLLEAIFPKSPSDSFLCIAGPEFERLSTGQFRVITSLLDQWFSPLVPRAIDNTNRSQNSSVAATAEAIRQIITNYIRLTREANHIQIS